MKHNEKACQMTELSYVRCFDLKYRHQRSVQEARRNANGLRACRWSVYKYMLFWKGRVKESMQDLRLVGIQGLPTRERPSPSGLEIS